MTILKSFLLGVFIMICSFGLKAQSSSSFKLFFEKVYLHTDRDVYTQGDTIWYKAYLLNAQNNSLIGTSGNLYVELISPKAEIVSREIVRLDYGLGNADFKLSDTIPSGKYILRAYTNWMRNFGNNFIFEKNITILNLNPAEGVKEQKQNTLKVIKSSNTNLNPVVTKPNIPVIRFYPEGGSLIEGLPSIVAVKAEGPDGKGIAVNGIILSTSGDTVTNFVCDRFGMAQFSMLPIRGQVYRAMVNRKYKADLPVALRSGLTFRISRADTIIKALINCNDASLNNQTLIITGKHGGKTCFSQQFRLTDSQAFISMPENLFPEGIAALTLAVTDRNQKKPYCERLVYVHHPRGAAISISTDKAGYQPREKVTVHVKAPPKSSLSLAAVDESVFTTLDFDINSYLMLKSEIKGNIEHPEQYFDTTNNNRFKQLDLLMMTQGWRDFVWRRLADSAIRLTYAAENNLKISGRVRQKLANNALKGLNVTLNAFKARGTKILSTQTDSAGKFYFDDLQLYGNQPVKLTTSDGKGKHTGWITLDSLTKEPLPVVAKQGIIIDTTVNIAKATYQKLAELKIKNGPKQLKEVNIRTSKYFALNNGNTATSFGYPDQVFNITKKDEYFESLENWLAHNVTGTHILDIQGVGYGNFKPPPIPSKVYPTFIVNDRELYIPPPPGGGSDIDNSDYETMVTNIVYPYFILSMDKVKKVTFKHWLESVPGGAPKDIYLLFLTTTPDAFENTDFGLVAANVKGYYEARTFYKPIYDIPQNLKKPDYRTTVHWEPNLTTNDKGEATITYYNSDPKTNIRLIIEGVTSGGTAIVATNNYQVK